MIVLDQHHVVQTETMIGSAAGTDRGFFQFPKPGCCFSGIENGYAIVCSRFDELAGQRCDPAQPLQKIQRHPFPFQNGAGPSVDLDDAIARLCLPRRLQRSPLTCNSGSTRRKTSAAVVRPGDDRLFPGHDAPGGVRRRRHKKIRRYVALPDVLPEGDIDRIGGPACSCCSRRAAL